MPRDYRDMADRRHSRELHLRTTRVELIFEAILLAIVAWACLGPWPQ